MYTLDTIKSAPSYKALKRNGMTDENVIQFYSLPSGQRGAFLNSFKSEQSKPTMKKPSTQKCTEVDIDAVRDMALEYMEKDWEYRGRTYNMAQLGWRFAFNDRKRALGLCSYGNRTIYLSQWFIEHNTREMKMWKNTMIHEIAHAINGILGGRGHDWQWKHIFITLGGNGQRTSGDAQFGNLLEKPISKYTLVCDSCGKQSPSYKIKKRKSACGDCCNKHNGGRYSEKYVLRQIKNY